VLRRWRALRVADPRGEAGYIWIPLLIAVGTGLVFIWAVKVGVEYAQGEVSGPAPPPPIQVAQLHTFEAPPANDCATRVLSDFPSVSFNKETGLWEAPDQKRPVLPYKPDLAEVQQYNKQVKFWNELMDQRVGVVLAELRSHDCFKQAPPIEAPKTNPPNQEAPSIFGTYHLKATGGSLVPECSGVLPPTLTVSPGANSSEFNVAVAGHGDIPGKTFEHFPLTANPTFTGDNPEHFWSISGGFIQRSSGVVVTGTFTYNVGGGCGIDYEGTTTGQ
jgi:hypothetical protein